MLPRVAAAVTLALMLSLASPAQASHNPLVISEVKPAGDEFVEILNVSPVEVPATPCVQVRTGGNPPGTAYCFPADVTLEPGQHWLLAEAGTPLAGSADGTFGIGAIPDSNASLALVTLQTVGDQVGWGTLAGTDFVEGMPTANPSVSGSIERAGGRQDTDDNLTDFVARVVPDPESSAVIDDRDGDGVLDNADNCIAVANPTQADLDSDGQGDACDDTDGDGLVDVNDNCAGIPNPDQADLDADRIGDICDPDDDNDGVGDLADRCPRETALGLDGCGLPSATDGRDVLVGTAGPDTIRARGGDDEVHGLSGNDLLCGESGRDELDGDAGSDRLFGDLCPGAAALASARLAQAASANDVLIGGRGNDRLSGGPGLDFLDGGAGRDRFAGGSGRDRIESLDGRRESVNCGPGRDRVLADRSDRLRGCERVRRR